MNPPQAEPVQRTVQFYRIWTEDTADGLARFDNAALCAAIRKLQVAGPYFAEGDGDLETTAYLDDPVAVDRFALAKIRRRTRPLSELAGVREPIRLALGAGILEPIHIRLFNNNILGAEFNINGPRATKLRDYLRGMLPEDYGTFDMESIFDRDAMQRLQQFGEIRLFQFEIDLHAIGLNLRERNYIRSLIASGEAAGTRIFEVILRVGRGRDERLDANAVKEQARELFDEGRGVKKLKVKGRVGAGDLEDLDLLKDRLVSRQEMMSLVEADGIIEPGSAYAAIGRAYNAVMDRIPEIVFAE